MEKQVYFIIFDTVIINLKKRFSDESLLLASAIDNFFLMDVIENQLFINHYEIKINSCPTTLYIYNIKLHNIQFQGLFNIEIASLKTEMMVLKNCSKKMNKDFDLKHLKNVVEINVNPNLYKLLQVIHWSFFTIL